MVLLAALVSQLVVGLPVGAGADEGFVLVKRQSSSVAEGFSLPGRSRWLRVPVARGETVERAVERWRARPDVVSVQPDFAHEFFGTPNDPGFSWQWNLTQVGLPEAWERSTGAGVIVAVIDSGLSIGDDLACRKIVHPYNAAERVEDLSAVVDTNGHGTHVAGTIAQCADNAVGVAGVAPSVELMPIKVGDGAAASSTVAEGIHWAVDHGADVINLSLGYSCSGAAPCGYGVDVVIDEAIAAAVAADVVVVAAAGNSGADVVAYPAAHPAVIAVGASTEAGTIASYSNRGAALSVVAPGGGSSSGILQQTIGAFCRSALAYDYCESTGTSMAAPHVAGIAALVRSLHPSATAGEIRRVIEDTAVDLGDSGFDTTYGHGRVRADAAVAADVVLRLAGGDRYATAAAVSRAAHPKGASTVFVATGTNFPDALAGTAAAGALDAPILLTARDVLPSSTIGELIRLDPETIVILGGPAAVSDAVRAQLEGYASRVERRAGPNRFATAASISSYGFPGGSSVALLATGMGFADALAGGPVAAALGGPVLLTAPDVLPEATRSELQRLGVETVYVLGGPAAVSEAVMTEVKALVPTTVRVAGIDRYSTSVAIAQLAFGPATSDAFVAVGDNFPDALAGGAAAGFLGGPVLLVRRGEVPSAVASEIERLDLRTVSILGGSAAIDAAAEVALSALMR